MKRLEKRITACSGASGLGRAPDVERDPALGRAATLAVERQRMLAVPRIGKQQAKNVRPTIRVCRGISDVSNQIWNNVNHILNYKIR